MAKNILICDDAAFMRMMIKDILTKNGYNIAGEAENGVKAVEKYSETKPDLVLMDITMPEMDGIQALKKIKEAELPKIRLKPFDLYYEAGMGMEYYFPYFKLTSELKFAFGTSNIIKPDGSQYTTSVKTMYTKMVVLLFHFQ